MVSANRVAASGWMEGSVVVSVTGQKCSMIKGILTYVIARHRRTLTRAKWGEERKYWIKNLLTKTIGWGSCSAVL